jgi:hypothetical protein
MSTFNYIRSRTVADKLIQKFGMAAVLRPVGAVDASQDRSCWVVITDYNPRDQETKLANPTDRKVIMSAGLGAVPNAPPNNETDLLVTFVQPGGTVQNEVLPFTSPVKPFSPAGVVVVYEFTVRR